MITLTCLLNTPRAFNSREGKPHVLVMASESVAEALTYVSWWVVHVEFAKIEPLPSKRSGCMASSVYLQLLWTKDVTIGSASAGGAGIGLRNRNAGRIVRKVRDQHHVKLAGYSARDTDYF